MLFRRAAMLPANYLIVSLDAGEKGEVVFQRKNISDLYCRCKWGGILYHGESHNETVLAIHFTRLRSID